MTKSEDDFTAFLFQLADRIQEETRKRYNPTLLRDMLHRKGGVEAAKQLINDKNPSAGFTKLWEFKCLHLTVEAQVLENEIYHHLFTSDDLEACRKRLRQYEYLK